jgi:nucleoside-diphosphate-sugar epimerase
MVQIHKKKIVLTGGSGYIASKLIPALNKSYECILLDIQSTPINAKVHGLRLVDLSHPDIETYREYFRGAYAVVNLAHKTETNREPEAYFSERMNLDITRNVLEVSRQENIRRVVCFSSNHATDWHEKLFWEKKFDKFGPEIKPLSNNLYGLFKVTSEHLGFVYASGNLGRPLDVIFIRLGHPEEPNLAGCQGNIQNMVRQLAVYISTRDLRQLVIRSIETKDIRNEYGVPFQIFYGISNNTRALWSIINARNVIRYDPQDDSEVKFAEDIAKYLIKAQKEKEP